MATLHFTTIFENLTQPKRHRESRGLYNICPFTKGIELPRLKDSITFLYVLMNVLMVKCASHHLFSGGGLVSVFHTLQ